MKITVIGESNIDVAVVPHSSQPTGGCAPSKIAFHHGGVARNIAHNLCLLGHEVRLMTVFGGDDLAAQLIADCKAIGMDLSLSSQFTGAKSPIFLSISDKTGDMRSAYSDVELNNRMDLEWVKASMAEINRSDMVVANTLLTAEALSHLMDHCEVPLYIDSVSAGRALRLVKAMEISKKKAFHALKCNLSETIVLSGNHNPYEAARMLNSKHIDEVFVTMGPVGAVYATEGETEHFPALPVEVVNATGSGDAFLSGVVHANTMGIWGSGAVKFGLEMAKANCEAEGPVAKQPIVPTHN